MASTVLVKPTPETARYLRKLQATLSRGELTKAFVPFMERQGSLGAAKVTRNMLSGQRLKRRTGSLARGMVGRAELRGQGLPALRVGVLRGPSLKYAEGLEDGADIEAKPGKALAIPQDAAKTKAGVSRWASPRDYPGELKLVPFRRSGVAVAGLFDADSMEAAKGPDGEVDLSRATLLYILVKRVHIPAFHYLRDGFNLFLPEFQVALADFVRDLFRRTR